MPLEKFFYKYNKFFIILLDFLLIGSSYIILAWIKPETISYILPNYTFPFFILAIIWLAISFLLGKYDFINIKKPIHLIIAITSIAFLILSIVSIILFALKLSIYSRIIVFGTILLCYIFELISFRIIYEWLRICILKYDKRRHEILFGTQSASIQIPKKEFQRFSKTAYTNGETTRRKLITRESGSGVYEYFSEFLDLESESIFLTETATQFNIENINRQDNHAIINLKKVNDTKQLNNFFEAINYKLADSGIFIGCMETKKQRKIRILKNKSVFLKKIIIALDFIANIIQNVLFWIKSLLLDISTGIGRSISKAEVLGRLVSCGFEIIEYKEINNLTYFVVMKTGEPSYAEEQSYGLLFKMPRIGMEGKNIYVYKFRTMFPYSEYLQDYVIRLNGYSEIGKPAADFRLTKWGKFLRKNWLDELPQLINVLRGEMNIIGIRPLSRQTFNEYPDDVREMRIKYKPGCIPPYVALLKQGMEQSIDAERTYLLEKEKNSLTTDFKYFKLALYNILTNKIRSA